MIVNPPIKNCYYIDNFLDKDLLIYLRNLFIKLPHYYGHSSKEGKGNAFYNHDLDIKEKNKIKKVDFVQNRLVYFDASIPHRGRSPNKYEIEPRITLAFKTKNV